MFSVKRGEIEKRLDPHANQPKFTKYFALISEKFEVRKLSEITSVIFSGITPKSKGDSYTDCYTGIPFIRVGNIADNGIVNNADIYIRPEVHNGVMKTSQIYRNDVLISIAGTIGKVGMYKSVEPANINQAIAAVRINDERFIPEFILYYLKSPLGQMFLDYLKRPVVQANINLEEIGSIEVPLLSYGKQLQLLDMMTFALQQREAKLLKADVLLTGADEFVLEQIGISEIFTRSQIAVAVTLKAVKSENTMGAQYYHPERLAVIRALENDKFVSTRRLADIVDFVRDLVIADNGKSYLGLASVVSNTGELSSLEENATGQAFVYQAGDVLYARLRPYLNKVLYVGSGGICSTEFHVMRVKNTDVLPEYLAAIMRSKIIVSQTKYMMTGNTHPRISNDAVQNLRIPIPSIDIQRIIVKEMRNRIECSRWLKNEAETEWAIAKEAFEQELLKQ